MTKIERKHEVFVREMVRTGDQVKSYMKAYPKCQYESARTKGSMLLKNVAVNEQIRQASERLRMEVEAEVKHELKAEIMLSILNANEKRGILAKIAKGEPVIFRTKKDENGEEIQVPVLPDITDMMKAIDLDNKMAGDYAPEKLSVDGNINTNENKSTEDLMQELSKYMVLAND